MLADNPHLGIWVRTEYPLGGEPEDKLYVGYVYPDGEEDVFIANVTL